MFQRLITDRNEVGPRYYFHKRVSRILSTGGGGGGASVHAGIPPREQDPPRPDTHPPSGRHPPPGPGTHPGPDTPPGPGTPPRPGTPPPDQAHHPPWTRHTLPREEDCSIRSMSGRYASYWNVFSFYHRVLSGPFSDQCIWTRRHWRLWMNTQMKGFNFF